jgi:purine nucleosidase
MAAALQRAPGIGAAAELEIMRGDEIGGNMSPHASSTSSSIRGRGDRLASGLPITLVPLDLSHQMLASLARIERFAAIGGPVGRSVAGMLRYFHDGDGHLHDPLTIAWLLRPDLFTGRRAKIHIETSGTRDGETVFDWREDGNCRVLLEGKDEDFFDFLIERLARL